MWRLVFRILKGNRDNVYTPSPSVWCVQLGFYRMYGQNTYTVTDS